jgi:hypothetical protein
MKLEIEIRNPFSRSSRPVRAAGRRALVAVGILAIGFPILALAAPVTIPHAFSDGGIISAGAFNENFEAIAAAINDNDARLTDLEQDVADLSADTLFPAGAVAFFNSTSCPGGWSELQEARGRVLVGMNGSAGTLMAEIGTALEDEGAKTITETPSHAHPVSLSGTAAGSGSDHTHGISGGVHSHPIEGDGAHSHSLRLEPSGNYGTYGVMGTVNNTGGHVTSEPLTTAGAHTHSITPNTGGHSHTVSGGTHTHSVTVSGNTGVAGVEGVDVTMPYLQLLACVKD